ncbi:uncharacterized protein ACLA_008940 [Aspergillus clavatus NRRL 1]|uniref:Secreted protein n=1 Tax=Aspergillus clavatus (strain ATCC 1007 / CBS 513.65 / DSM 816 / NCTC 3887 / NRRL 1 / QM 1276 / 107) TaxID=344612 RepID=A1C9Q6_ASPCL|nr:uncharacterized protein ACLA_008940 [Aspergillus clavatus NRRL 1]EAW12474.1 hypothetical protein ACLA_008940 [Aspergillus clavatus NRRL 1]
MTAAANVIRLGTIFIRLVATICTGRGHRHSLHDSGKPVDRTALTILLAHGSEPPIFLKYFPGARQLWQLGRTKIGSQDGTKIPSYEALVHSARGLP